MKGTVNCSWKWNVQHKITFFLKDLLQIYFAEQRRDLHACMTCFSENAWRHEFWTLLKNTFKGKFSLTLRNDETRGLILLPAFFVGSCPWQTKVEWHWEASCSGGCFEVVWQLPRLPEMDPRIQCWDRWASQVTESWSNFSDEYPARRMSFLQRQKCSSTEKQCKWKGVCFIFLLICCSIPVRPVIANCIRTLQTQICLHEFEDRLLFWQGLVLYLTTNGIDVDVVWVGVWTFLDEKEADDVFELTATAFQYRAPGTLRSSAHCSLSKLVTFFFLNTHSNQIQLSTWFFFSALSHCRLHCCPHYAAAMQCLLVVDEHSSVMARWPKGQRRSLLQASTSGW